MVGVGVGGRGEEREGGREGGGEKDSFLPRSNNVWRLNSLPSAAGNKSRGRCFKQQVLSAGVSRAAQLAAVNEVPVDI